MKIKYQKPNLNPDLLRSSLLVVALIVSLLNFAYLANGAESLSEEDNSSGVTKNSISIFLGHNPTKNYRTTNKLKEVIFKGSHEETVDALFEVLEHPQVDSLYLLGEYRQKMATRKGTIDPKSWDDFHGAIEAWNRLPNEERSQAPLSKIIPIWLKTFERSFGAGVDTIDPEINMGVFIILSELIKFESDEVIVKYLRIIDRYVMHASSKPENSENIRIISRLGVNLLYFHRNLMFKLLNDSGNAGGLLLKPLNFKPLLELLLGGQPNSSSESASVAANKTHHEVAIKRIIMSFADFFKEIHVQPVQIEFIFNKLEPFITSDRYKETVYRLMSEIPEDKFQESSVLRENFWRYLKAGDFSVDTLAYFKKSLKGKSFENYLSEVESKILNFQSNLKSKSNGGQKPLSKAEQYKLQLQQSFEFVDKAETEIFGLSKFIHRLGEYLAVDPADNSPVTILVTGPREVGKRMAIEKFAKAKFRNTDNILVIDGANYSSELKSNEWHALTGAPVSFQGQQKGELSEFLKKTNGSGVVLFRNYDLIHPEVWRKISTLFTKGYVTDGAGTKCETKKLFIFLTGHRGVEKIFPDLSKSRTQADIDTTLEFLTTEKIKAYVQAKKNVDDTGVLIPEIASSINEYIAVGPISKDSAVELAWAAIREASDEMLKTKGFSLRPTFEVINALAENALKVSDSGKALKRMISNLLKPIPKQLIELWNTWPDNSNFSLGLGSQKAGKLSVKISSSDKQLEMELGNKEKPNPIEDPEIQRKIERLKEILPKRIFGQEEALTIIQRAVISQFADRSRVRPMSVFLVGSTGTGKTEIGKALAEALFNDVDELPVLSMGKIMSDIELRNFLGHQGSKTPGEFERALEKRPNGGVIVLDEISNMGGIYPEMKTRLFQQFYEALEEGKWTSPTNPEITYDLSKYFFVMTGNDGEHITQQYTSETLRELAWKDHKERSIINKFLNNLGIPDAFLKRTYTILMKPLKISEMFDVTKKLLDRKIQDLENDYDGLKINYDHSFIEGVRDGFFLSNSGGRSVRDIVENRLPGLILESLLELKSNNAGDTLDLNGVVVNLKLVDNRVFGFYIPKVFKKRNVTLAVQTIVNGNPVHSYIMNLTDESAKQKLLDRKNAFITAFHEAGHAIANVPELTGTETTYISILPGNLGKEMDYLGIAVTDKIDNFWPHTNRKWAVARLAVKAGGYLSQRMAGFEDDLGASNDIKEMRKLAERALLNGLERRLLGVRLDQNDRPILTAKLQRVFDEEVEKLMKEAEDFATEIIKKNWGLIRLISFELIRKGEIIGKERFLELKAMSEKRSKSMMTKVANSVFGHQAAKPKPVMCRNIFQ